MEENSWYERLLDTVKDVAPSIAGAAATALSGGNPAAGALVTSVINKVMGKQGVNLEDASQEILADPNKLLEFRGRMRDAEIWELEVRTKDVQNARGLLQTSKGPIVISTIIVIAFILLVSIVMFVSIPPASANIAYLLMGTLAAEFTRTTTFWLGSSQSSKDKDSTLNAFAQAARTDQETRTNASRGIYNNIKKGS